MLLKIDRLLSIIVFLLDRDLVSAREMAERFSVTQRTIQRDMDAIGLAGIPVYAVQGPNGGYGILESFKMDRRLVSPDDLYFIITSLRSVADTLGDGESHGELDNTLEKMKGLLPSGPDGDVFADRSERLSIDFSMLGSDPRHRGAFRALRSAVDSGKLVSFTYTSNKGETLRRTVEAMTVAFKWRSWYLFAWCRHREDYRLFRISRIRDVEIHDEVFIRRGRSFDDFASDQPDNGEITGIEIVLRFRPELRHLAEEYYEIESETEDGSVICRFTMPEDGWLYGYILSWGEYAEVLAPESLRNTIASAAESIRRLYD